MTDTLTAAPALRAGSVARAPLEPEILDGGVEGLVLDRAFGDRVRRVVVREGATILDILEAAEMPPRRARRCVVRVNGEDVPLDAWESRRLRVGDIVAVAVRPGKGGKSNPLRTILQLIVYAVAVVVGIFYGPAAAALVNAVGSFLINALVPPPKPKQDPKESPTYAIEGAANELRLFGQVPVVMGARRVVLPHAARPYTEIVGNDVHYRMLLTGGVGPATFSDIRVGETPISEMDEFSMEVRTGEAGEPPVTLYTNQPREAAVGVILTGGADWIERETDFDTDEISVDVVFARGLVTYNDEGNRKSRTVNLEVRWARAGTSDWVTLTPTVEQTEVIVRGIFGTTYTRLQVTGDGPFATFRTALLGTSGTPTGSWQIKASDAKPVRRNRRWAVPRGRYRVQMRRLTPESTSDKVSDETQWATLRSIKNEQPSVPPGTPLLALNIRATDRVNGQIEAISAVVTSIRPKWNGTTFGTPGPTRNPGDLLYAALTGPGNARPQPLSRIAVASLGQFAELCAARGWTADFVFEDGRSVGEVFRAIAACGRGAVTRVDGRYSVFPDVPRLTTGQLYTPRNSRGFRAKRRFLPEVHALRIPFPNEEKQHRSDERIVYADGYDETNATIYEVLTFDGITNPAKVHEHGRYYLAQLKLRPESYVLTTDVEHAVSAVGDVAYIQHDAILVGQVSARVVMRLTNPGGQCIGVRIDEAAVMESGKLYGLRVRRTDSTFDVAVETDAGDTRDLIFSTPMTMGAAPRAGDLVSFGERGLEAIEVIVRRKGRPAKDKTVEVEFEPYGHPGIDDATTGTIPPWTSGITDAFRPRPPQPEVTSVVWGEDGIRLAFKIPPSREAAVAGFAVRWRETPDDGGEGDWERLPQLGAGERTLVTPPPPIGTSTDIEIVAFDATGNRGPAALQIEIESEESVAAPTIISVTGISKTGPGGASVPAVKVTWTPALETRLNRLAVQLGPSGATDSQFLSSGSLDPKAGQGEVAANVPPGGTIDARFRLESRRGAFSDWVPVTGIVMPQLVANDSQAIGGVAASALLDDLEGAIADAAANAAAIVAETIARAAADGVIQTAVTSMEVSGDGALNQNPVFRNWPVAGNLPTGWLDHTTGGSRSRVSGTTALSPYAIRLVTTGGVARSLYQNVSINPGWHVAELDIVHNSGTLTGFGVYVDGAVVNPIVCDTTPDSNNAVLGATPATGRRYRWRVLFNHLYTLAAAPFVFGCHPVFGSVAGARDITVENCRVRPAEAAEIETGVARGASASLSARIASEATVASTATAAVATRVNTLEATAASPTALPDRVSVRENFTNANPTGTPAAAIVSTAGTVVAVQNEGDVIELTGSTQVWWTRGWLPLIPGHTYRYTCRNRVTVDGTANVARVGYTTYNETGGGAANVIIAQTARTVANGWVEDTFEFTTAAAIAASSAAATWVRPFCRASTTTATVYSGATSRIAFLRLEDITDVKTLQASISSVEASLVAADTAIASSVTTLRASVQRATLPSDFQLDGACFTFDWGNFTNPGDAGGAFSNVSGIGRVMFVDYYVNLCSKGYWTLQTGKTYRVTCRFRTTTDGTSNVTKFGFATVHADLSYPGYYEITNVASAVADGWRTLSYTVTETAIRAVGGAFTNAAFIRPMVILNCTNGYTDSGAETQVALLSIEDVTTEQAIQAQVTTQAGALVTLQGKTEAWLELALSTGVSVDAFVRARTTDGSSAVGIGADVVGIFNRLGDDWKTALKIAGGDVTVLGNILAGGKVYIGSTGAKWELALAAKQFAVADGATLTYGVDLGVAPDFDFSSDGLAALAAGESYNLYTEGATATSAVMRLKIRTPGTPAAYSKGPTSTNTGGTPKFALSKGSDPDANGNLYTFNASFTLQATISSPASGKPKQVIAQLGIYSKKAGVWTREGALYLTMAVSSSGTGVKTYTPSGGGAITLQSAPTDFGVHLEAISLEIYDAISGDPYTWNPYTSTAGAVTALNSVTWTNTPSSSTRSATPGAELGKVLVRPKNVA